MPDNNGSNVTQRQNENAQTVTRRSAHEGRYYTPLVDVIETREEYVFAADVPGVKTGDVDITFENGVLTLRADVKERAHGQHELVMEEYGVGSYYRSFDIDTPIDADRIRAELRNGELLVHLPKEEQTKPRRIEVKAA